MYQFSGTIQSITYDNDNNAHVIFAGDSVVKFQEESYLLAYEVDADCGEITNKEKPCIERVPKTLKTNNGFLIEILNQNINKKLLVEYENETIKKLTVLF